jgi:alpha/beta superfamily hydrolase
MRIAPEQVLVDGPAGNIDVIVEAPASPKGIALVGHPHPLFGGTNTNKVAQTLAKSMNLLGYVALRPAFRGTGKTEGEHDEGRGETDDQLAVLDWARQRYGVELPIVLTGFSFGAFVSANVAARLVAAGTPALRMVLVGTAAGHVEGARKYDTAAVAADTIVIHGSADETVPLYNVLQWAEPMDLPVVVVAGADHFFHRRLHVIRDIILRAWKH